MSVNAFRPRRYSSLALKDLICLCAGPRDEEAWEEFLCRVGKPIRAIIVRTAALWGSPSPCLIEDLIQVTYLKLWAGSLELLRDFAIQRPEAILAYVKRIAANATHDYFKHGLSHSSGGDRLHISTSDIEPQASAGLHGSPDAIDFGVFLREIDEHLKHCLTGSDPERDRIIFWLYFRQGMTTQEIASLPALGLTAKGVGSVIERLKHSIRDQILRVQSDSGDTQEE
jgi:RNA polymerase sigma factor (sigma-70 family)